MRPRLIGWFVVPLLVLLAPSVFAAGPSTSPIQSKLLEPKAFKDDLSGLQINLPKGWVRKTDIKDANFEAPAKDEAKGKTLAPNILLKAIDAQGIKPSDLDELLKRERANDKKSLAGFKEVDAAPPAKVVPGKGVGVIEFTCTPQPDAAIHCRQVYIVAADKIYLVTWTSLSDTYASHQKLIDAAMNTLVVP